MPFLLVYRTMKRTLISLFWAGIFLLITASFGFAQSPPTTGLSQKKDIIKSQGTPAAPGTYQFIVIPTEKGDPFTNDYLVMIENYRDEVRIKFCLLPRLRKFAFPQELALARTDFKPLKEIVYIPNTKPTRQSR